MSDELEGQPLIDRANADMQAAEVAIAGGEAQHRAIMAWAQGLSNEDRIAYNAHLDDPNTHVEAFRELANRYHESRPARPFASAEEYRAARQRHASSDTPSVEYERRLAATSVEALQSWSGM